MTYTESCEDKFFEMKLKELHETESISVGIGAGFILAMLVVRLLMYLEYLKLKKQ